MHRRLALVLIAVILAAGCSSDSGDGGDGAAGGAALPFDAVLEEIFGTADLDAWRHAAQTNAITLVIECMADAGWEYQVAPQEPAAPTRAELADRDFRATSGFGLVANFREGVASGALVTTEDPNRAYLRSLSSVEINEYLQTLQGTEAEPGQLPTDTGCLGAATDQAYAQFDSFYDSFTNYTALAEERDTHPDWLAARADWRTCMLAGGFDYFEPEDIRSDVRRRMQSMISDDFDGGRLPIVVTDDGFAVDPSIEPLLAELQQFEVDAALADHDCNAPLAERFETVEREVQQAYVDRNRDALDDYLADLNR